MAAAALPGNAVHSLTGVALESIGGQNVSARAGLSFSSAEALRESCRVLLPNEMTQVEELQTIEADRKRIGPLDADTKRALRFAPSGSGS